MDQTSPEIISEVERVLERKIATVLSQEFSVAGGIEALAELLNRVDRATEKSILETLEEENQELAVEIKKLMFTFDDLILLDDRAIQQVLRDVDMKELGIALKGSNEEVKTKIFANLSSRAADNIRERIWNTWGRSVLSRSKKHNKKLLPLSGGWKNPVKSSSTVAVRIKCWRKIKTIRLAELIAHRILCKNQISRSFTDEILFLYNALLGAFTRKGNGTISTSINPEISIIIPAKNEQDTIRDLCRQILQVYSRKAPAVEIILIDDGSTDNSWEVMKELHHANPEIHGIRFNRNYGKSAALAAGIAAAQGQIIVTIDADLQDDPGEIPRLVEQLHNGFDLVSGWKKDRKDPWHKRAFSKVFNAIVSKINGIELHDINCGLKAYRKEIFDHVHLYGEIASLYSCPGCQIRIPLHRGSGYPSPPCIWSK